MDTTARIIEKRDLTGVTKLFVVHAPLVARNAAPGQFVILRVAETGERIPISITDFSRTDGTITIVVQQVGRTSALVCALEVGDTFLDFAGPLGLAVPLPDEGHAVLIGGGFGTGAVFPLARELRSRGVRVSSIVGARTRDLVILDDLQLPQVRLGLHEFLVADPRWECVEETHKWGAYRRLGAGHLREEWRDQSFLGEPISA